MEQRKATGAWRLADLRLRSPKVVGRVAFSHAQSDKGLPAMSESLSHHCVKTGSGLVDEGKGAGPQCVIEFREGKA